MSEQERIQALKAAGVEDAERVTALAKTFPGARLGVADFEGG